MKVGRNAQFSKKTVAKVAAVMLMAAVTGCRPGDAQNAMTATEALAVCQQAIQAAAPDGQHVEVPATELRETVRVFRYRWRIGDGLAMPNTTGTPTDIPADCRVNKETRAVVHLEVGGEVVSAE